jgi:hypothetical protein
MVRKKLGSKYKIHKHNKNLKIIKNHYKNYMN